MISELAGKVWASNLDPELKPLAALLADIGNADEGLAGFLPSCDGTKIPSVAYISVAYIAWLLGRSTSYVQENLVKLREMGVIITVSGGYHIVASKLPSRLRYKTTNPSSAELSVEPLAIKAKSAARLETFPEGFLLTPNLEDYAKCKGIDDPQDEFNHFRDHHAARGTKFVDWFAAWRNWCRNSVKFSKKEATNGRFESFDERLQRENRELLDNYKDPKVMGRSLREKI